MRVAVLVLPSVMSSASWKVPPTPLNVTGKFMVFPLLVMVWVPEVAPKVVTLAPAVKVIPEARVKFP